MNKDYWLNATVNRPCPICASTETALIADKMQHGLDLKTVICSHCGMVFTNPVPAEEVYNRFYTDVYADYYGHITPEVSSAEKQREPAELRHIFKAIERFTPISGMKLMEIGPGKGQFLYWAKERGATVLGIEPSSAFHRILMASGLPSIEGTLEEKAGDLEAGGYDCIVMSHVLEHFYDLNKVLDICRKLLSDKGLLVILVPNILKPYRSLDSFFLRYVHLFNFSPATLSALLEKFGFAVELCETEGDEQWYQPHNMFVIARKLATVPAEVKKPSQSAEEVRKFLANYRFRWTWIDGPRWHLFHAYALALQAFFRFARSLKYRAKERLAS